MATENLLIALALIAVSLSGFSGLISANRTIGSTGWHPRDVWSLSWMLGCSMGALFLALLPLWLSLCEWSETSVYRASGVFASLYIASFVCMMMWKSRQLTIGGHPARVPFFPTTIALLLLSAAIASGLDATGWAKPIPAYIGALVLMLMASCFVLAVFLIVLAQSARGGPKADS